MQASARDAMMLNYKVLFVSDATATHTDFEHNITLNNMMLTFADVVSTADVTSLLKLEFDCRRESLKSQTILDGFFPPSD
jgi:nicotinamidase-related amidase